MLRNKQNLKARRPLPEQPAHLETVHPGHGYVEDHDVRLQAVGFVQGLNPIRRFSHYLPV